MPGIYQTSSSGVTTSMKKAEYIAKVVELVKQGKVKNINLDWTYDTGTNNSNYMHTVKKGTGQYYTVRDGEGGFEKKERTKEIMEPVLLFLSLTFVLFSFSIFLGLD